MSLIEDDEDDPTGRVFERVRKRNYHNSKQPLPIAVREWLKTVPLKLIARALHIDRNSLRKGRDGGPVARGTQNKVLRLFLITKRAVSLPEALKSLRPVKA